MATESCGVCGCPLESYEGYLMRSYEAVGERIRVCSPKCWKWANREEEAGRSREVARADHVHSRYGDIVRLWPHPWVLVDVSDATVW